VGRGRATGGSTAHPILERVEVRWRRIRTTRSVIEVMAVVFAVHMVASRFIELPDAADRYQVLTGVAYFVFGLFSAFAIESSRSRLARINELLKGSDGEMIALLRLAAPFGAAQDMLRVLIDRHMQEQIDYRLIDFDRSAGSLRDIEEWCSMVALDGTRQEIALDHMLGCLVTIRSSRQQLEALVRQRVTTVEWISVLSMLATLWLLMLASGGGPFAASVLGGALIASLAGTVVVLWHLSSLTWQEGDWIWRPLDNMFRALDLLPYYHRSDIDSGRVDPPRGSVRVAEFPHEYPDLRDKVVEIVAVD